MATVPAYTTRTFDQSTTRFIYGIRALPGITKFSFKWNPECEKYYTTGKRNAEGLTRAMIKPDGSCSMLFDSACNFDKFRRDQMGGSTTGILDVASYEVRGDLAQGCQHETPLVDAGMGHGQLMTGNPETAEAAAFPVIAPLVFAYVLGQ